MQIPGYAGSMLRVDLSAGEAVPEPIETRMLEDFMGGWGLTGRPAWDLMQGRPVEQFVSHARRIGGPARRME